MAILAAEHESDNHFDLRCSFILVPAIFVENGGKMHFLPYFYIKEHKRDEEYVFLYVFNGDEFKYILRP